MIFALPLVVFAQISVAITSGKPTHADSVKAKAREAAEDSMWAKRDSTRARRDSSHEARARAVSIPVTPALLATAFKDASARTLLDRARAARLNQDSALVAYDATTYERISASLKLGLLGRERLLFRSERATHVQWARGKGAVVDVTGARAAVPLVEGAGNTSVNMDLTPPLPYFPGRETLWVGSGIAKADADATEMIHPLANGAEAYYTYATGDSATFQLPGRRVVVRELRVQPRTSRWNTVVGSLWFDNETGQLVRGVFRMAEPMNVMAVAKEEDGEDPEKDIPVWLKPAMLPMTGSVNVITVDYGLFEGRFWLPRLQTAEGLGRAGPMRFPFELRQRYDYDSVNGTLDLPKIELAVSDTARNLEARRARRSEREAACTNGATMREVKRTIRESGVAVLVRVPCDTALLARSPTLPKSIYDKPDSLFNDGDMDALVASALGLGRQAGASTRPATITYGVPLTRYNRIEGLSTGIEAYQELGSGYTGHALARIGFDLSPNAEVGVSRTNLRETYTFNVYRRLNSAMEGRNPFSLSASLSALLFGHDDGTYFRSWGAELVRDDDESIVDSWRLFTEQEFDARTHTTFSFAGKLRSGRFANNIDATNGTIVGLVLRKRGELGEDPDATRMLSDVRVEGAAGTYDYTRGMIDLTFLQPITHSLSSALTVSGGTSGGAVPTQRLWYLGGTSTIRGQDVGVEYGNAYWLTRLELGLGSVFARPLVFGDLGWAGDRHAWNQHVIPASGAGVGASFMDGLVRVDVAKGIRPNGGVRASLYLDARF